MTTTTTLTETKPLKQGWYWFLPNGLSPKSLTSRVAVVMLVDRPNMKGGNLCVQFPRRTFLVSEMAGLWSQRLKDPEKTKDDD